MVRRLRQIPEDKWDWSPDPAAPTPRMLACHAWQWLISDRQHIRQPDARRHDRIPDPPADPASMCEALEAESRRWNELILSLSQQDLAAPRLHFNDDQRDVRWFVCHMVDNTIYKSGQLATLYFALGLDGTDLYSAPLPNPEYDLLHGTNPPAA
jgi:hypothetical protein